MILPGMPRDSAGPVFNEPWEARAFAMTVRLHERGLFTWPEWAAALADEIAAANVEPGAERSYYRHWLQALESLVERTGAGSPEELARYSRAWQRAALRTPHGRPVELCAEDLPHGA
jgi:nitrile hydratase accessory protein